MEHLAAETDVTREGIARRVVEREIRFDK
jgi:hypothetical protein